jgi:hypothetical protein
MLNGKGAMPASRNPGLESLVDLIGVARIRCDHLRKKSFETPSDQDALLGVQAPGGLIDLLLKSFVQPYAEGHGPETSVLQICIANRLACQFVFC